MVKGIYTLHLREQSLSLTGTRAEANLQGYEIVGDDLCGFKMFFEKVGL